MNQLSAIVITIKTKADKKYLDKIKKKKISVLITKSAGLDHIDLEYAKKIGIDIRSLKEYHKNSVAEHYWNLLFRLMRPLDTIPGRELAGKIILIIGKGRIGKLLMKQAQAFGLNVLTYDILDGQSEEELNIMLGVAQIIFICVPLTPDTKNILSGIEFGGMMNKPFIVNAARTEILDLDTVDWAIKENLISGYAIDDKVHHPITRFKKDNRFIDCEQHMGAQTVEAQQKADLEISAIADELCRSAKSFNLEFEKEEK